MRVLLDGGCVWGTWSRARGGGNTTGAAAAAPAAGLIKPPHTKLSYIGSTSQPPRLFPHAALLKTHLRSSYKSRKIWIISAVITMVCVGAGSLWKHQFTFGVGAS